MMKVSTLLNELMMVMSLGVGRKEWPSSSPCSFWFSRGRLVALALLLVLFAVGTESSGQQGDATGPDHQNTAVPNQLHLRLGNVSYPKLISDVPQYFKVVVDCESK